VVVVTSKGVSAEQRSWPLERVTTVLSKGSLSRGSGFEELRQVLAMGGLGSVRRD
jgi:hypothetical protein